MKSTKLILFPVIVSAILSGCARVSSTSAPQTSNKTAHHIYRQLPKYADKSANAWQPIHPKLPIKVGDVNEAVPSIRNRLIVLDDLDKKHASQSQKFDLPLEHAVLQFQWRHGIRLTGIVGEKTMAALNVNPRDRYAKLVSSMHKWAKLPENEGSHYIHVNVPSFKMYLVKDGQRVINMKVVAGKASRATPEMYSKLKTIVFNPHWNVPPTIVSEDVIPSMRKNPNYMNEHYNMKLYASWKKDAPEIDPFTVDWHSMNGKTFPYRITAPPGDQNPLGRVKFVFENDHAIYMHGTPAKELFSKMKRDFSSGCIRLEHPLHLVEYFYDDNTDLDPELVNQYLSTNQTKYIKLRTPIPVKITYITAWVDANGKAHFREDIYGKYQQPQNAG